MTPLRAAGGSDERLLPTVPGWGPHRQDGRLGLPCLGSTVSCVPCVGGVTPTCCRVQCLRSPSPSRRGPGQGPVGSETRKDVRAGGPLLCRSSVGGRRGGLVRPGGLSDSCLASQRGRMPGPGCDPTHRASASASLPRPSPAAWPTEAPSWLWFSPCFSNYVGWAKNSSSGALFGSSHHHPRKPGAPLTPALAVAPCGTRPCCDIRPRAFLTTGGFWAVCVPARGLNDPGRWLAGAVSGAAGAGLPPRFVPSAVVGLAGWRAAWASWFTGPPAAPRQEIM